MHVICQGSAEVFHWKLCFMNGAASIKTIEYCMYLKVIDAYLWEVSVWCFPAFLCICQVFEMDCMLLFSCISQVTFTLSPCYSWNVRHIPSTRHLHLPFLLPGAPCPWTHATSFLLTFRSLLKQTSLVKTFQTHPI